MLANVLALDNRLPVTDKETARAALAQVDCAAASRERINNHVKGIGIQVEQIIQKVDF